MSPTIQVGVWNSTANEHNDVNRLSLNETVLNAMLAANNELPLGRHVLRVVATVVSTHAETLNTHCQMNTA